MFITGGNGNVAPSSGFGGVIYSTGPLAISDCGIEASSASSAGGAIYQAGSALTVTRCSFLGNFATQGASIWSTGIVNLQYCSFDSNRTNNANSGGGGVWLNIGSLTIDSCTFRGNGSNNATFGKGGAIYANGTFVAHNSTFVDNGAHDGGGLYLTSGGTLWNCTVASNLAQGGGSGGGIHGSGLLLESTIVSNNNAGAGLDIFGSASAKYCALGNPAGFTLTDQGNNLAFGLNLQLSNTLNAPGAYVSGTSIQATSPCKDAGSNPAGLTLEGRGPSFQRVVGSAADIGAYEVQLPPKVIVQFNGGAVQHSRVTTFSYTFSNDILFSAPVLELKRVPDNSVVTLSGSPAIHTLTTITYPRMFSGGPVNGDSLADGVYELRFFSSIITDSAGQNLDGNGDGIGGDDYVSPTTPGDPNRIFRLFGDVDGDADVDTTDFIQYRLPFGATNFAFHSYGDGAVAASDFIQFRLRFGSMI